MYKRFVDSNTEEHTQKKKKKKKKLTRQTHCGTETLQHD